MVRRILRDGPAGEVGDVLGICEDWPDDNRGELAIRRADGELVRILVEDVLTGKPVPPRASVRHRVTPRAAEEHALGVFPGTVAGTVGDWVLRSDPAPVGRLIKRANSALAMGDPGLDFTAAQQVVRDFYRARARRPLAQVDPTTPAYSDFHRHGWVDLGEGAGAFQVASVAQVRRVLPRPEHDPTVDPELAVQIHAAGSLIAAGRALLDGDWLGLYELWVDPDHRRRGLATTVLAALLSAGAERGSTTVWLHVELDNQAALSLYASLGFRTHHEYRYLIPGTPQPAECLP